MDAQMLGFVYLHMYPYNTIYDNRAIRYEYYTIILSFQFFMKWSMQDNYIFRKPQSVFYYNPRITNTV